MIMKVSKSFAESVGTKHDLNYVYSPKVTVISSEPVEFEGRVINKSVVVEKDLAEEKKLFKPQDFYLENVIAVGAVGSLTSATLDNSKLSDIDKVVSQLEKIEVSE